MDPHFTVHWRKTIRNLQPINKSKINYSAAVIAGCAIMLSVASVNSLDKKTQLKLGKMEYLSNCAACHGRNAKGGGPVAAVLSTKPSDLTMISKEFNGKFPEDHIYNVINGHDIINSHGETDMAVVGGNTAIHLKGTEANDRPLRFPSTNTIIRR